MKYDRKIFEKAKRLHGLGLSYREVARRLGIGCHKVVAGWVRGESSPHRLKRVEDHHNATRLRAGYESMSVAKGYVLGCLCGDASIYTSRGGSKYVRLMVCDRDFAEEFAKQLNAAYGTEAVVIERRHKAAGRVFDVQQGSALLVEDIERVTRGKTRTRDWEVPAEVVTAEAEVRGAFLRGFFDSEGFLSGRQLQASTVNAAGMAGVQALLGSLGVEAKVYACRRGTVHAVCVAATSREAFRNQVGFSIRRKLERLDQVVGGARG